VSKKREMLALWRTDTSLHGAMRGGEQDNFLLAFMERACPEAFLADSSLVHACRPCCVDLLVNHDLGASLFQVLRVTGLRHIQKIHNNFSKEYLIPEPDRRALAASTLYSPRPPRYRIRPKPHQDAPLKAARGSQPPPWSSYTRGTV